MKILNNVSKISKYDISVVPSSETTTLAPLPAEGKKLKKIILILIFSI